MAKKMRVGKVMLTAEQIGTRILELAQQINRDCPEGELIVVGILKGSFVFMSDLVRRLSGDIKVYFMQVSSYGSGTESTGVLHIKKDIDIDISGKNILVVEDIVDSGNTMVQLSSILQERNPASVRVCTLLDKPERRKVAFTSDYTGFEIPDRFIVGYGLDCDEQFRHLPYIAEVEIYEEA